MKVVCKLQKSLWNHAGKNHGKTHTFALESRTKAYRVISRADVVSTTDILSYAVWSQVAEL